MSNFSIILAVCIGALACSDPGTSALPSPDADMAISAPDSQVPDSQSRDGQAQDDQAPSEAGSAATKISNLSVTALPKMPTILKATWETSRPCTGKVRFGLTAAYDLNTPSTSAASQKHQVLLIGLPANSDIFLEVIATPADGSAPVTLKHKARTGKLPAGLPTLTLSKHDKTKSSGGYTLIPIIGAKGSSALVIVDDLGRYVWWNTSLGGINSAHISIDRKAVLALESALSTTKGGSLEIFPFDGGAKTTIKAPGAHTDFVEVEAGKYAALGWEVRKFDNGKRKLLGDTIIEFSKGKAPKVVWNVFDHFQPDLAQTYSKGWYLDDKEVEDWSHVNGLYFDSKQQSYFATAAGALELVMKISRATGKAVWSLGALGDLTSVGQEPLVRAPHSVQSIGTDRILVFNRGELATPGKCSNATEILIDVAAKKAVQKWTYKSAACYQVYWSGDADRLWNGNTMVNWSTAGHIEEVTNKSEVVWSLNAGLGAGFNFAERVKSLY